MRQLRCIALTIVALGVIGLVGVTVFILSGVFNIAATAPHGEIVYHVVHEAALRSIAHRAQGISVPNLDDQGKLNRGAHLFDQHCAQCHGAPGQAPADFAKGLEPGAPRLAQIGQDWRAAELYWTIAHGIKMTAMPAWEFRLSDDDLWAVVAFVRKLPTLSPAEYATMTRTETHTAMNTPQFMAERAAQPDVDKDLLKSKYPLKPEPVPAADPARGRIALQQYACSSCHEIPGLAEAVGRIGPPLTGIANRKYLAGILANTPQNMLLWIRHPQQLKPHDAMPNMNVSEQDARDMVAYLETLQ